MFTLHKYGVIEVVIKCTHVDSLVSLYDGNRRSNKNIAVVLGLYIDEIMLIYIERTVDE